MRGVFYFYKMHGFIKDVVKLDIIGPYDERYLEMSTFFILKSASEYINVESDYFESFKKSNLLLKLFWSSSSIVSKSSFFWV